MKNIAGSEASEKHFARDLLDYGFVPVQILVELDVRSEEAFILQREELRLVLRDGTRLESLDPKSVIADVSFSHWRSFFGFLFLLPGPFVTSSVSKRQR